ncbi:hypothetical protein C1J03_10840 [Sulfitobacter sp. SK012]|nr:hypothetical protein C1J03_10840 [Sulfitobacter sp. SK012]
MIEGTFRIVSHNAQQDAFAALVQLRHASHPIERDYANGPDPALTSRAALLFPQSGHWSSTLHFFSLKGINPNERTLKDEVANPLRMS